MKSAIDDWAERQHSAMQKAIMATIDEMGARDFFYGRGHSAG